MRAVAKVMLIVIIAYSIFMTLHLVEVGHKNNYCEDNGYDYRDRGVSTSDGFVACCGVYEDNILNEDMCEAFPYGGWTVTGWHVLGVLAFLIITGPILFWYAFKWAEGGGK